MTTFGTVSAVIPVFNGAKYVTEAIRSVLNQSRPPIECIVVDDGSTDETLETVRDFGRAVAYVRQPRAGVSAARNRGAQVARGDLVAFLDHDDIWLPTKLERQLDRLRLAESRLALCAVRVVDADGNVLGTKRLRAKENLLTGMLMFDGTETVSCSSTGVIKRETLLACGGFDPTLSISADWDLLFRMLLIGGVEYVDDPLVLYRVHDGNMSKSISAMERDMRHAFDKAFANPQLPAGLRRRRHRAYARLNRMLAGSYRDSGDTLGAWRTLAMAVRTDPTIASEVVLHAVKRVRTRLH